MGPRPSQTVESGPVVCTVGHRLGTHSSFSRAQEPVTVMMSPPPSVGPRWLDSHGGAAQATAKSWGCPRASRRAPGLLAGFQRSRCTRPATPAPPASMSAETHISQELRPYFRATWPFDRLGLHCNLDLDGCSECGSQVETSIDGPVAHMPPLLFSDQSTSSGPSCMRFWAWPRQPSACFRTSVSCLLGKLNLDNVG